MSKKLSDTSGNIWTPSRPLGGIKIPRKWPKRLNLHFQCVISQPPGGQSQKRQRQSIGLVKKIIPAKFHPDLSIFKTTYRAKTGERRVTPPPATIGLLCDQRSPPQEGGSLCDPSSPPELPWKRETSQAIKKSIGNFRMIRKLRKQTCL